MISSCAIILLILFLINRQSKSRQIENYNLESINSINESIMFFKRVFFDDFIKYRIIFLFFKGENIDMAPVIVPSTITNRDDPSSYESLK